MPSTVRRGASSHPATSCLNVAAVGSVITAVSSCNTGANDVPTSMGADLFFLEGFDTSQGHEFWLPFLNTPREKVRESN